MATMFAKVFSQIFDSTIAEDYKVRHVFMDLLVMSDSDGVVDKTPAAIARIANVPISEVEYALKALMAPDKRSRTPDQEGRRLQLIDSSRDWGWKIVNFEKYREIRDEEARRIANRSYKRDQRARQKSQQMSASCPDSQQCQPIQKQKQKREVKVKTFAPPALEEVVSYCSERKNSINPQQFIDWYAVRGWRTKEGPVRDWKACIRTWEHNRQGGKHDRQSELMAAAERASR